MAALTNTGITYRLNQNDVYIDDTIDLTFSTGIMPSTANSTTIQVYLTNNGDQRMNASFSVNGNVLSIKGGPVWPVNSSFRVIIVRGANGLLGTGNEQLGSNIVFEFKTTNKLKPNQTGTTPEDVIAALDQVTDPAQKPVQYVVPDVDPQGDIQPFIPCTPSFPQAGIPQGYVSGLVSGVTLSLEMIDSIPKAYEMGVIDASNVVSIWSENIQIVGDVNNGPMKMTVQDLQIGASPFAVSGVPQVGAAQAVQNQLSQMFEAVSTLNREFTVNIGAGRVRSVDGTKLNGFVKFRFTGPLDPMFCTFEMAVNNAGLWGIEFTDEDIYEYTKMIHRLSISVMTMNGFKSMDDVDEFALNKMANYVCCSTALALLTYQNAGQGTASAAISGSTVKKRQLPGVVIEYGSSGGSSGDSGGDPYKETIKRLMDCIEKNKPGGLNDQYGWYGIQHGIKSLRDRSYPLRRRN